MVAIPYFTALSTYSSYALLFVVGHLRDFFRSFSKSDQGTPKIDCAADLPKRSACRGSSGIQNDGSGDSEGGSSASSSITLSGFLNFADGLWSSCGEEKIMIFTTNHKGRLDPALLRSGWMDMHILLSYCGFEAFKQLAFNYLDLGDHFLFSSVEEKMKSGGSLTPADICEILFQNKSDPDAAIRAIIGALDATISKASEEVIDSSQDEDEEKSPSSPSSSSSSSSEE